MWVSASSYIDIGHQWERMLNCSVLFIELDLIHADCGSCSLQNLKLLSLDPEPLKYFKSLLAILKTKAVEPNPLSLTPLMLQFSTI